MVEALGEAAEQALKSGNRTEARELFAEAIALARDRGQLARAAEYLSRHSELAAEDGDRQAAVTHAREAGDLYAWAGMLKEASGALRRALSLEPNDVEALALLEAVARALGEDGAPLLVEVLQLRVARAAAGPERAEVRVALAEAQMAAGGDGAPERAEAELRRALADDPGCTAATERLTERLADAGRNAERARLMLERAAHETDAALARGLRRDAATLLAEVPSAADRAIAAATFAELAAEDARDLEAHRGAARLFRDLGQRERSISHLAALVRADPDDEAAARELADAYSGRHRDRAELFLGRAETARGEVRSGRLREAAKALFAAGEDARAKAVLLTAFQAWPADDTAFVAALREATADVERLDGVLSARAAAVPAEAAACHRARADALLAFGETERALAAYHAALDVAPEDVATLAALAACLSAAGRDAEARAVDGQLISRSEAEPGAVAPSAEANARYRRGLAAWAEGRPVDGIQDLERALSLAPADDRAGVAWAALAHGHAARGEAGPALAAARSRTERAHALGLGEERRQALEAGVELAAQLGDAGPDAAELLVSWARLRHDEGASAEAVAPLARRAAASFTALGAADRAAEALRLAGLAPPEPEPEPAAVPGRPPAAAPGRPRTTLPGVAPSDPRQAARQAAERALATEEPAARAAAFIDYADALTTADAPADEVRTALDLAAEADPDAPEPWRARARVESAEGQPAAAARAHLSVSIRTEGEEAARSALEAARLFEGAGLHPEAIRAYKAAIHAQPGCPPARTVLADEALAAGDAEAAAAHLSAIAPESVPQERRPEHARRLARAFEAADRRADAEAVWNAILQGDPHDAEAFEHAAALAQARGALEHWMELAQVREQALARAGDEVARADLRCARGEILAASGRLEAARGALLSALELVRDHRAAAALAELDGRRDAWEQAARELSAEAAQASDPAERAALHLRRARILRDRLGDPAAAAVAAEESLVEARASHLTAAHRTSADAEALLHELGQASGEPAPPPQPTADPVSAVLRAQAQAARGNERAELFERLAGHLERAGDRDGAADALLAALEADPDRELTYSWLRSVAAGDAGRLAKAAALRAGEIPPGGTPPRTTLRFGLGQAAAQEPAPGEEPAPPARAPRTTLRFGPDRADAEEPATAEPLPLDVADLPPLELGLPTPAPRPPSVEASFFPPLDLAPPEPGPEGEPEPELSALLPPDDLEETPWAPTAAIPDLDFELPLPAVGGPAPDGSPPSPWPEFDLPPEVAAAAPEAAFAPEPSAPAAEPAPQDPARTGREHLEAEEWELAYADLSEALDRSPRDPELIRDLMRAAEKVGQDERYVELGEFSVDALAAEDLVAAAARLRHLAEVLRTRLGQPERAAQLLEKALALVPGDADTERELAATLAERPRNAPRALESWLAIARQEPGDAGALSALAALCRSTAEAVEPAAAAHLAEQGRIAASLAAFITPASPRPPPPQQPTRIPADLRARIAVPPAAGPSARLLALLAPWLEPLFPADLGRRGASSVDWLAPPRAPALRNALEAAARALGTRPHAAFLTKRPGVEAAIENTQPPAMVFSAGVGELPESMLPFLAARTLELVQHGWALGGKFAPRDVGILLELACRFAGGTAPSLGLPAERAGSYLAALSRTVPAGMLERARLLAPDAARELASFDPKGFGEALRHSASRLALLYAGDPGDALRVLSALEAGPSGPPEPAQAIALPELDDLARFALSDAFIELRLSVLG